jgi:hypothetical protein
MWSKLLLLCVALSRYQETAFAQIGGPSSSSGSNPFMPGMSLGDKEQKQLTPEEQEKQKQKQKQLDADYKAATKKIPDRKSTDPWGGVRPTPTAKSQIKNESLTPYHRDSFNKQTTQ